MIGNTYHTLISLIADVNRYFTGGQECLFDIESLSTKEGFARFYFRVNDLNFYLDIFFQEALDGEYRVVRTYDSYSDTTATF